MWVEWQGSRSLATMLFRSSRPIAIVTHFHWCICDNAIFVPINCIMQVINAMFVTWFQLHLCPSSANLFSFYPFTCLHELDPSSTTPHELNSTSRLHELNPSYTNLTTLRDTLTLNITTTLDHINLILCCSGRNGLQMRSVGRFKNKNDSHVIGISCRSSPN